MKTIAKAICLGLVIFCGCSTPTNIVSIDGKAITYRDEALILNKEFVPPNKYNVVLVWKNYRKIVNDKRLFERPKLSHVNIEYVILNNVSRSPLATKSKNIVRIKILY